MRENRGRAGPKPGSVPIGLFKKPIGWLSIWDACYQTPLAARFVGAGKKPTVTPMALHPTGVYLASTSRCCRCALTAPLHPYS